MGLEDVKDETEEVCQMVDSLRDGESLGMME